MAPERGKRQAALPDNSVPAYGELVRVRPPRDPRYGQDGTVRRVVLRGADLHVTVQFDDGQRADYFENELLRHNLAGYKLTPSPD